MKTLKTVHIKENQILKNKNKTQPAPLQIVSLLNYHEIILILLCQFSFFLRSCVMQPMGFHILKEQCMKTQQIKFYLWHFNSD